MWPRAHGPGRAQTVDTDCKAAGGREARPAQVKVCLRRHWSQKLKVVREEARWMSRLLTNLPDQSHSRCKVLSPVLLGMVSEEPLVANEGDWGLWTRLEQAGMRSLEATWGRAVGRSGDRHPLVAERSRWRVGQTQLQARSPAAGVVRSQTQCSAERVTALGD